MAKKKKKKKVSRQNKLKLKNFVLNKNDDHLLDRDTSLLSFQNRVLSLADDSDTPILERLRFLSIFHSNIDDFFMKRMWICRHYEIHEPGIDTYSKLTILKKQVEKLFSYANQIYTKLKKELAEKNVHICDLSDLSKKDINNLKALYLSKIFPILTPLAVDLGHPFPHISSRSVSLAVALQHPDSGEILFSRVKIPEVFPPFYCLDNDFQANRWVRTEDIISYFADSLFPKMKIIEKMFFRITRNIEVESDDMESSSLLDRIEAELRERKYGEVVKLEYKSPKSIWLLQFLKSELEIFDFDIYELKGEIDFSHLNILANLQLPKLRFKTWAPTLLKEFSEDKNIFNILREKDVLVHHPFESFSNSVENLVWSAAEDKEVLAIKMTFYRTNEESSIVPALIRAAENGKQVVCLIELQARMDEERNIDWATRLERAGCHVVYGFVGLKTHCKVVLVVRREYEEIKCYAHIGTGNYNSNTAKLYTDMGLMTSDERITSDIVELFNYLTGRSLKDTYNKILKAPVNMKEKLLKHIQREKENAKKNLAAEIIFKCNNLEDKEICEALYSASQAGVKINLIIRSICTLRPGIKKLSENINVVSIVDKYLEHSRIFYFRNTGKSRSGGVMYIGSADLMSRNLERRVEVLVPLVSELIIAEVLIILDSYLQADGQTWQLLSDGTYKRLASKAESSQQMLLKYYENKNKLIY